MRRSAGSPAARARSVASRWPIVSAPARFLAYLIVVELATLAIVVREFASWSLDKSWSAGDWPTLLLLAAIAIGYEESARRATRLRIRLSAAMRTDMTSVWSVAAIMCLPPAMAVLLLICVLSYDWFRQWRPAGEVLFKKIFTVSTILIACLAAGWVYRSVAGDPTHGFWTLRLPLAVLGAILTVTVVNRLLVSVGVVLLGGRVRALLGTLDDNLVEFATLCLGGLVGAAVVQQPWLALLVFAPLVTLQRGALLRELESAASVDAKTGLLNAVAWEQVARRELSRAERLHTRTGVIIVDLDRFKTVNDAYGHLAGDRVLRGIGKCIEANVREYDTVGRFGGEEFVAVLPDVDESAALVVAERIRSKVNELGVAGFVDEIDEGPMLSVSVGVSCTPTDGTELAELLHAADGALYAAKDAGRNRVRLALRGAGGAARAQIEV